MKRKDLGKQRPAAESIAIYSDPASRASATGLKQEFERALGTVAPALTVCPVTAQDLLSGAALTPDTKAFVLPGIVGEDSLYHAHIGPRGNDLIRRFVQDGGVFMGLCAGAYYAASIIEYRPEWAAAKGRTSGILSLFNGVARGPVPGLGLDSNTPNSYNGCTLAPVILEGGDKTAVAYSCGPAFYGLDHTATILAHYDTPEKPVAAFTAPVGEGLIILSGILPQYGVPAQWQKPDRPHPLDLLIERLQPYEAARRHLWDHMAHTLYHHAKATPP